GTSAVANPTPERFQSLSRSDPDPTTRFDGLRAQYGCTAQRVLVAGATSNRDVGGLRTPDRASPDAEQVVGAARSRAPGPDPSMHVEPDFTEEFPGSDPLSVECYLNIVRAGDRLLAEINRRAKA